MATKASSHLLGRVPEDPHLLALTAIAAHSGLDDVRRLFGEMTRAVAELVGCEKVIFGLLDHNGHLVPQLDAFGLQSEVLEGMSVQCQQGGEGLAEQVVFDDWVFRAAIDQSEELEKYRSILDILGVSDAAAVSWRVGGEVLGILAAFNSRNAGFEEKDIHTLRVAGACAALVWKHHSAEVGLGAAMQAMREEAERAGAILRALDDVGAGVVIVNIATGRITYANGAYAAITGYSKEELLDFAYMDLLGESPDVLAKASARVTADDDLSGHGEMTIRKKGGTLVPVAWGSARMTIGGSSHSVGIVRDISDHKLALRQLEVARIDAVAANEAKSSQLSRISHELRTPLTAIIGYTDLLLLDEERDVQHRQLESVMRAGEHLVDLVDNVLAIALAESGEEQTPLHPVDVIAAVEDAAELVASMAKRDRPNIRIVADGQGPVVAEADTQRLLQVLLNLLSNATKYGGPHITVNIGVKGERVRVSVADDGPGLNIEDHGRIFEPFERWGAERTEIPGTGLGLSVARALTISMGGAIGLDADSADGTTFWVELNRSTRPAEPVSAFAGITTSEPGMGALTVLYVEDNLETMRLMEAVMEQRPNIHLLTAMQGGIARDLARGQKPDLIILDVHLPDVSGLSVLTELKNDPATSGIPVAMLSADASEETRQTLVAAGAATFITKPVHVSEVLALVDSIKPSA